MWIGLILGLLLALLGLSGSMLVYDDAIADLLAPAPQAVAKGEALSLDKIAEVARGTAGQGAVQIVLPRERGEAIVGAHRPRCRAWADAAAQQATHGDAPGGDAAGCSLRRSGFGRRCWARATRSCRRLLMFAHQLHGNFLMGRDGRTFVGWLGVAMLILGVTGLVLWWPKRGQWKYAFFVRRTATGLRFHRELHAATGIWIFVGLHGGQFLRRGAGLSQYCKMVARALLQSARRP